MQKSLNNLVHFYSNNNNDNTGKNITSEHFLNTYVAGTKPKDYIPSNLLY